MSLKNNKRRIEKSSEADQEIESIINSEEYLSIITEEEAAFISQHNDIREIEKGTLLLRRGQIARNCYHVFKGCIREYIIKDDEEITTGFYTAGDSLSDDASKLNQTPSSFNWECVVDTIVSIVPLEFELELYKRFPRLETLCRIETEKRLSDYKVTVSNYNSSSAEERYETLLNTRPEIFELVPLYHIASYLGVKPESLSRIRNRLRNADR